MAKVTIDGTEHEVELKDISFEEDETPSGFIAEAQMQATIKSRVKRAERDARKALQDDEDFVAEILEAKGIELREDGSVKGTPRDIKEHEERWKKQHLAPLSKQLEEATSTINSLRGTQLENEILLHAGDVEETLRPAFIREVKAGLSYDEETGKYGIRGEDGFKFTTEGKLAGVKEYVEQLRSDQPAWFRKDQAKGSNYNGHDNNSGSGRTYTRAEFDKLVSDPEYFQENETELVKAWEEGRVRG